MYDRQVQLSPLEAECSFGTYLQPEIEFGKISNIHHLALEQIFIQYSSLINTRLTVA